MEVFYRYAAIVVGTAALAGTVQAQTGPTGSGAIAQAAPPAAADSTPVMQALQAAITAKDTTAIFNLLNATPRDQRGAMATLLLQAAQTSADKQFAATLASLAFISGGLTAGQQNAAITIVRNSPGGLAIVGALLANNTTGGFGFSTVGIAALVTSENPNINSNVPNPTPTGSQS